MWLCITSRSSYAESLWAVTVANRSSRTEETAVDAELPRLRLLTSAARALFDPA